MKKPAASAETAPTLSVTDAEEKKRLEKIARFRPVYAARMLPDLARALKGRAEVEVPLPETGPRGAFASATSPNGCRGFVTGDRLFYREWRGGPTGRADLLTIREFIQDGPRAGNWARCYRGWSWLHGKIDDDLSELALRVVNPEAMPLIGSIDLTIPDGP